jgi:cytochrome b6-f complex iron-sulfur subunit
MSDACSECGIQRRAFLRSLGTILSAVGLALSLSPGVVESLPVGLTEAIDSEDETKSYPIPAADGTFIDKDAQVILVRFQNTVYAFNLSCPHQNTALHWLAKDNRFQCPKHKSKYQPDGTFISGRATRNMDRFALRKDGNKVVVDLDQWFRSDKQAAQWAAAKLPV